MGVSHVNPDLTNGQAFGVEVICTFVLILTVFGVTDSRRADVKGPVALAIGFAAIGTHLFGIPYTGASMNPARSFGPALVMGGDAWTQHWIYWVGPLFGSILATLLYTLVFREKKILLVREEAPENNCVDEAELKMMS
ncbi:aquaporin AQPAe.a-like [Hyalella azteca]|uniref:Aquaporin AQPAe.a-like n=1 Tax=Hyalella azteca TaxID=294128 RepID=A0A8B7PBQ7_HYAAZ|nr:aquaporin AQPAe.a-like [Hyalella azteca]